MMRQFTAVAALMFLSVFTPTLSQLTLEFVTVNKNTADCSMYPLNAMNTFSVAIGSDPPPAVKDVGVTDVNGVNISSTGYFWAQGYTDTVYTPISAKTLFSSITGGSISGSQPSGTNARAFLQLYTDGWMYMDAASPLSQPAASGLKGPQGQDLFLTGGYGTIVGANFAFDAAAAAPALATYLTKYIGTYSVTDGFFSLQPTNTSGTKPCQLTLTNFIIRGSGVCPKLYATIPVGPVDAIQSATATARGQLVAIMGTSTDCPSAERHADYVVVSQSPNWIVRMDGVQLAQIISWGSCNLAVIVPYKPVSGSLTTLGITPQLDDDTRPMLFLISIERMTYVGVMANDDAMIIDVIVSATLEYVLMFKVAYKNGKTLESQGGKKQQILVLKFRLYLPHTSTIAGYGGPTDAGSSAGLYGLFALIALPVLLCLGLLGWLAYEYSHTVAATEEIIAITNEMPQAYAKQYIPSAYMPAAPTSYMPSAYLPPSYLPAPTPM